MKQHKYTCFQAATGFFETNREGLAFFSSRQRKSGENPIPWSPGVAWGMVRLGIDCYIKRKIPHQVPVSSPKYPRLDNIIDPGDNHQFVKDIEIHKNQDQALIFHNDTESPGVKTNNLNNFTKHTLVKSKIKTFKITEQGLNIYVISVTNKVALSTTSTPSLKKFTIIKVMHLKSICLFLSSCNTVKLWNIVISVPVIINNYWNLHDSFVTNKIYKTCQNI